jgi:hypothetical protein
VKICLLLAASGCILGADTIPRLFFSKTFPGSTPAFVAIIVDKRGDGEYREAPEESNPLKFQMSEAEVTEAFGLAEKLDYFRRNLESPLKVAFTGTKVLRYENGAEKGETKLNFSEDPAARALIEWFERISESEQHLIRLERTAKYDKLGVLNALLLLESAMDRKRLVAPQQFLPMLDRINKNQTYLHAARTRAAALAEFIRANQ